MLSILQNKRVLILIGGFVFIVILLLVFAAGGTEPRASSTSPVSPYLSVAPAAPASAALGEDLLTSLALLKTISLDTSVVSDTVFESLSDWSKKIPPQPAGRRNPFAPLGAPKPSSGAAAKPAAQAPAPPAAPAVPPAQTPAPPSGFSENPSSGDSDASVWDFSDIDFEL